MKSKVQPSSRPTRKRTAGGNGRAAGAVPGKAIRELARERRAKPFDPLAFAGIVPPSEDLDAFVQAIYRART